MKASILSKYAKCLETETINFEFVVVSQLECSDEHSHTDKKQICKNMWQGLLTIVCAYIIRLSRSQVSFSNKMAHALIYQNSLPTSWFSWEGSTFGIRMQDFSHWLRNKYYIDTLSNKKIWTEDTWYATKQDQER